MKTFGVPRPTDPELRRQWDEAKRACETRGKLPLTLDDETRPIWEAVQRAAAEVAAWPAWKHTEQPASETPFWQSVRELAAMREDIPPERRAMSAVRQLLPDPDCCVGDRSQCRCAPERGGWSDDDVEREKWIAMWEEVE